MRSRVVALVLVLLVLLVPAGCGQPDAQVATSPTSTATAQPVAPAASIGAVFLGDGPVHSCTGSILHSRTGDLVLTAAHCLANGVDAVFVPGFADTAVPADNWHLDTVYLDPRWVSAQDPLADFAIARVSRAAGGSIEAVAGAALMLGSAPGAGYLGIGHGLPVRRGRRRGRVQRQDRRRRELSGAALHRAGRRHQRRALGRRDHGHRRDRRPGSRRMRRRRVLLVAVRRCRGGAVDPCGGQRAGRRRARHVLRRLLAGLSSCGRG